MTTRLVKDVPQGTVLDLLRDLRPGGNVAVWIRLTKEGDQWFDHPIYVGKGDFVRLLKNQALNTPVAHYYVTEPVNPTSRYATRIVYVGRGPTKELLGET